MKLHRLFQKHFHVTCCMGSLTYYQQSIRFRNLVKKLSIQCISGILIFLYYLYYIFVIILFSYRYIFRCELHRMFVDAIKALRGRKNLKFHMRCDPEHFVNIISLPKFQKDISKKEGVRVALSVGDEIIRSVIILSK